MWRLGGPRSSSHSTWAPAGNSRMPSMPFHRTRKSTSWLHTLDNRQQVGELRRAEKSCPLLSICPCIAPACSATCSPTHPLHTSLRTLGWGGAACHAVPSACLAALAAALAAIVAARFSWTDGCTRAITCLEATPDSSQPSQYLMSYVFDTVSKRTTLPGNMFPTC